MQSVLNYCCCCYCTDISNKHKPEVHGGSVRYVMCVGLCSLAFLAHPCTLDPSAHPPRQMSDFQDMPSLAYLLYENFIHPRGIELMVFCMRVKNTITMPPSYFFFPLRKSGPEVIKLYSCSTQQRKFHAQLCLARKKLQLSVI